MFLEPGSPFGFFRSPFPPVVCFPLSVVKRPVLLALQEKLSSACLEFHCRSLKEPSDVVCGTGLDL